MNDATCWCGNEELTPFDRHYGECSCGTLVRMIRPAGTLTEVRDEDQDLYGRNYWFDHQRALGLPDLDTRAETDLHDRCVHWLAIVLAYVRPPARVLEIGAGHGGFLKLLTDCGFDALGVELSPWVAEYARRRTGAQVLAGPLAAHNFPNGSFDLIVAFDVLEHLPEPLPAVCHWRHLLHDDGLLVLQTPRLPAGKTAECLARTSFGQMFIPEHLHLFSESSARELLCRAGLGGVAVEPPVFDTDMILVAGRCSPRRIDTMPDEARPALPPLVQTLLEVHQVAVTERRALQEQLVALHATYEQSEQDRDARLALLRDSEERCQHLEQARRDADHELQQLAGALAQADADRIDRLTAIEALEHQYARADADRIDRLARIRTLEEAYAQADADRIDRLARIRTLEPAYARADADRIDRLARIRTLEAAYAQADADRTARLQLLEQSERVSQDLLRDVHRVAAALAEAERDASERRDRIGELEELYAQVEHDRMARVAELALANERHQVVVLALENAATEREHRFRELQAAQEEQARRLSKLDSDKHAVEERFATLRAVAADHQNSRVYKAMVRVGRWQSFHTRLTPLVQDRGVPQFPAGRQVIERQWTVSALSQPSPEGAIAVDLTPILAGGENGGAKLVALSIVQALARLAPDREWLLLTSSHSHHEVAELDGPNVRRRQVDPSPTTLTELLAERPIAALFSPMTASVFDDPRVPVVSLIHDAQVWAYPEFFEDADRQARRRALDHVITAADGIVTPSGFNRDVILGQSQLDPERVRVIPHAFAGGRLPTAGDDDVAEVLERYALGRDRYFVYPANFWPHKNHLMLLVAFGQLCGRRPDLSLRLVLTGASRPDPRAVRDAAAGMGLNGQVLFTGFVPDAELAALLAGSLGVIFPSLYEGFGMPVLEAFAAGCPVACANATSLPEVAGDAALTFDARKPADIAAAMEQIATDATLRRDLRTRGATRAAALASIDGIAAQYLAAINSVLGQPRRCRDAIASVFNDGWTNSTLVVSHAGDGAELLLQVENPRDVEVTLSAPGVSPVTIPAETGLLLRCALPVTAGNLVISVSPTFRPADDGRSTDRRQLGIRVWSCQIQRSGTEPVELLRGVAHV